MCPVKCKEKRKRKSDCVPHPGMEESTLNVSERDIFIFVSDMEEKKGRSLPYLNAIEGAVVKYI